MTSVQLEVAPLAQAALSPLAGSGTPAGYY